jgi:Asp-tRNA(Asn)/Glu-tRNA(Gln) amidotransferase A subunit family amidase
VPRSLPELAASLRSDLLPLGEYLDRLEAHVSQREPEISALLAEEDRFIRLRLEGEQLHRRYPNPQKRPPLFGVPVGVKDIFNVDGFETRAGSRVPPEDLAGPEAAAVVVLRRAGALILGKTVTTEFAYFAPGPTRNPADPERTPGGSSSGSAAAVAAGMSPLALGTQTIGSICRPASYCGVVGFKPSYDRVSRHGVVPLAPSLDHVGCFTADVSGARMAAAVLCLSWRPTAALGKPVLGIPESPYLRRAEPEGRERFRAACERLVAAGFTVRSPSVMKDFEDVERRHRRLVAAEAAAVHAQWFDDYGDTYHEKTRKLIEIGRGVSPVERRAAIAGRGTLRSVLESALDRHGIDLWISPAAPSVAPSGLDSTGDPVMNLPWTHAGMPSISLPLAVDSAALPFGLQLAARHGADEELLAWAAVVERALAR